MVKRGGDESIFAWTTPSHERYFTLVGMLATSPDDFASSGTLVPFDLPGRRQVLLSFPSGGLTITSTFKEKSCDLPFGEEAIKAYEVPLACADAENPSIPVMLSLYRQGGGSLVRRGDGELQFGNLQPDMQTKTFNIKLTDGCAYMSTGGIRPLEEGELGEYVLIVQINQPNPTESNRLVCVERVAKGGSLVSNKSEHTYRWRRDGAEGCSLRLKFRAAWKGALSCSKKILSRRFLPSSLGLQWDY